MEGKNLRSHSEKKEGGKVIIMKGGCTNLHHPINPYAESNHLLQQYDEEFPDDIPPPLPRRNSGAPDTYGLFNDDGVHEADSKSHANPNERYTERLKAKNFVMVSKAEADKLISKSIANTLRNHKNTKRKIGKGIYVYILSIIRDFISICPSNNRITVSSKLIRTLESMI